LLDFQLSHARARDAVHAPFDSAELARRIQQLGITTICLSSAALNRQVFLTRPDLGRQLNDASRSTLAGAAVALCDQSDSSQTATPKGVDLTIVVSDGLSALAAERQVVPLLAAWLPLLRAERRTISPVVVVERGRVFVEDEIGAAFSAQVAVILIGERPGLGSPDSLGAYLVYAPRPGLSDAHRNCVSNIRPQGLSPENAAQKLHYLFRESLARQLSGIALKDESLAIDRASQDPPVDDARLLTDG
jgi:ethanolamine ammonia-lyase small subunit